MVGFSCDEDFFEFRIAMEFMEAGDLSKLITEHPSGLQRALAFKLASNIMNGLCFLHGKQFIHRDLKPSNILLTHDPSDGKLKAKIAGTAAFSCSLFPQPLFF